MKTESRKLKAEMSMAPHSRITHHALRVLSPSRSTHHASRIRPLTTDSAFSLIEIMVTIGLLSLIVLGLLAMFTQTKRAFTSSMTQTDVMESGRAVVDMMLREMEQMTPSRLLNPYYRATNFFVELTPGFDKFIPQGLPGTQKGGREDWRTNMVQRFFFVSKVNQDWVGIGYHVFTNDPAAGGVGTLYRFTATTNKYGAPYLSRNFDDAIRYAIQYNTTSNLSRIADGVMHLRVGAFATNGYPVTWDGFRISPDPRSFAVTNVNILRGTRSGFWNNPGIDFRDRSDLYFVSNAVPAYVELELGIVEPKIVERYRSMAGNIAAQTNYLSNHVAQVHLFRHRIPIRNVDFSAYQ